MLNAIYISLTGKYKKFRKRAFYMENKPEDKSTETPIFHGSDLELIEQHYGIPKDQIISFSANINPLGMSPAFRQSLLENIDQVMAYPDREYTALRSALSEYCKVPAEHILVGGGATELISRFIQCILPKKAMLLSPTYSEYEREIKLSGGELIPYYLEPDQEFRLDLPAFCSALDASFDLLILCNPNNPTGSVLRHDELHIILEHCKKQDISVMIDETYVEFAENIADVTAIPFTQQYENLFVLRGISKFFAAPGLRFGYAVTGSQRIRDVIQSTKNPWTINSLAASAGASMFSDEEYIRRTKEFISSERKRLVSILMEEPGLHVYPPAANFILMKILKDGLTSFEVFEHLIKDGLMLRDCSSFEGLDGQFIRFCFSASENNDRLVRRLREIL